jgi:hypothetical protein
MARKVYFSFHYERDVVRVSRVRNSNVVSSNYQPSAFLDHADWESIQKGGDVEIKKWIDNQLNGSTVTCVLIGRFTDTRKWVHYEIQQSILRKNALLSVFIHNMQDFNGNTDGPGFNPMRNYKIGNSDLELIAPAYDWDLNDGYKNFGLWIDEAVTSFKKINHFRG